MVGLFAGVWCFTVVERLFELRLSFKNAAWSKAQGGLEFGQGHYPTMVVLHTLFLCGMPLEVWLLARSAPAPLVFSALVVAILSQGLRWWAIRTLGPRWNTRVIIVPNLPAVTGGPYRWFRHPNYVAVVAEGVFLPLVGGAWVSALVFTLLNAMLLRVRIRCENEALDSLPVSS